MTNLFSPSLCPASSVHCSGTQTSIGALGKTQFCNVSPACRALYVVHLSYFLVKNTVGFVCRNPPHCIAPSAGKGEGFNPFTTVYGAHLA